ncbi:MAG: YdeI/OmpD-associated family protein [Candidatus Magasanikbacteria bacterium]|nr:YdeI/OmpD-associated family protein [Candidatus Magasanikbacteria bacterium]
MEATNQFKGEIISFKTAAEFRKWLSKNHTQEEGIWIRFFKKDSGLQTFTYAEALDEALCYGWIDSQKKTYDNKSFIQKFSQHRARSVWSQRNMEHIERLIKAKKMRAEGLKQYEAAKKDGRLDNAYAPGNKTEIPEDLMKVVNKDPKLKAFVAKLNKANIMAIAFRLSTAKKPETRERRFQMILEMLKKGEKFY